MRLLKWLEDKFTGKLEADYGPLSTDIQGWMYPLRCANAQTASITLCSNGKGGVSCAGARSRLRQRY